MWLSITEYANKYRISKSCIRRMIRQNKVKAKKFGETWRIYDEEI